MRPLTQAVLTADVKEAIARFEEAAAKARREAEKPAVLKVRQMQPEQQKSLIILDA